MGSVYVQDVIDRKEIYKMTKTELYNKVSEQVLDLITTSRMSKTDKEKLMSIIDDNLKPKSGGGTTNPPQEIDGVMNYYCRFHNQYEPVENMVMSQNSKTGLQMSKGYCRASISKWNKTNSEIKKLGDQLLDMEVMDEELKAKRIDLKANLNNPEFYDFEADWEAFND